jgi:hypothetical protein
MARDMIQLTEDAGLIHRWTFNANRPIKFATVAQPSLVGAETQKSVFVCFLAHLLVPPGTVREHTA